MLDLNHDSGCHYGGAVALPDTTALIAAAIDRALLARQQEQAPRTYVSTSGLGRACLRQIQYDYLAVPKDEGRDFEPRTLRIFEAGHRGEDIVADWLRLAGFDLGPSAPTAASSASPRSAAGSRVTSTAAWSPVRCRSHIPRSGRTRRSAPRRGRTW